MMIKYRALQYGVSLYCDSGSRFLVPTRFPIIPPSFLGLAGSLRLMSVIGQLKSRNNINTNANTDSSLLIIKNFTVVL